MSEISERLKLNIEIAKDGGYHGVARALTEAMDEIERIIRLDNRLLAERKQQIERLQAETRRLRDELALIATADPLDLVLDPEWAQGIAKAALRVSDEHRNGGDRDGLRGEALPARCPTGTDAPSALAIPLKEEG